MKRGRNQPTSLSTVKKQRGTTTLVIQRKRTQQIVRPRVERKYFDSIRSGVPIVASTTDWSGCELDPTTINCLFAPKQGDDIFNRQGRKVQILAIKTSGQIGVNPQVVATFADTATIVRFHLVQDCQTNGAQLNAEDVIGSTSNGEPTDMFQNQAFFGRFKVLKTTKIVMQNPNLGVSGASTIQQGLAHTWKMNVKFKKPVIVHYNATNGGTIADVVDNSFHIIGVCSDGDLGPVIAYRCRTTFIDV